MKTGGRRVLIGTVTDFFDGHVGVTNIKGRIRVISAVEEIRIQGHFVDLGCVVLVFVIMEKVNSKTVRVCKGVAVRVVLLCVLLKG